jgi:hypothetical protein
LVQIASLQQLYLTEEVHRVSCGFWHAWHQQLSSMSSLHGIDGEKYYTEKDTLSEE